MKNSVVPGIMLLSILTGCSSFNPGTIRDNSKDPKSNFFVPHEPEGVQVKVQGGSIIINWKDISNYEDGYLVEKSLDDTTNFVDIATLPPNTTSYSDKSHTVGLSTFYRISSFIKKNGQLKKDNSKVVELKFNSIIYFDFNYNNKEQVQISWQRDLTFSDGVIIERKTPEDPKFKRVSIIDKSEGSEFDNISNLKTFDVTYRLSTFKYHSDSTLINSSVLKEIKVHAPIINSITFNSEKQTLINWSDLSNFETGFELDKASKNTISGRSSPFVRVADLKPNQTAFPDTSTLKSGVDYIYRISAMYNSYTSKKNSIAKVFYLSAPQLNATGTAAKTINLSWNSTSPKIRGFVLERSANDGSQFQKIVELNENTLNYEDKSVDRQDSYTYRVRTLSSNYSNTQALKYTAAYDSAGETKLTQDNYEYSLSPTIQLLNASNEIGIYSHFVDYQDRFYNSIFVVDQNSLGIQQKFNTKTFYESSYLSQDGKKLIQLEDYSFNLCTYDVDSQKLIDQILHTHQNNTGTESHGKIAYNYDDNLIVSYIDSDRDLKIWNTATDSLFEKLDYNSYQIRDFEFHPTKNIIAVIYKEGLNVWDITNKKILYSIPGDNSAIFKGDLVFSSSGDTLCYASNNKIFIIDNTKGTILDTIDIPAPTPQLILNESLKQLGYIYKINYNYFLNFIDLNTHKTVQVIKFNTFEDYPSFAINQSKNQAFSVSSVNEHTLDLKKWKIDKNWHNINE